MDFLFHESLLYTSIPIRRNVSPGINLRRLRDTLRRVYNMGFLVDRLKRIYSLSKQNSLDVCIILSVCVLVFADKRFNYCIINKTRRETRDKYSRSDPKVNKTFFISSVIVDNY